MVNQFFYILNGLISLAVCAKSSLHKLKLGSSSESVIYDIYDDIIEEREETNDEYKETIQKYKTAKKHLNLIKMLKLNSEKKQLKRMLDSLEKESS